MSELSINFDTSELRAKLETLKHVKNGAPKAVMRAMNRSLDGMKADASREVSARYINITPTDVKGSKAKGTASMLALKKASMSDMSAEMIGTGRPRALITFKTRRNKSPGRKGAASAFARVMEAESGGHIPSAFMATVKSDKNPSNLHSGVFVRTGKFARMAKGSSVGQVREQIRKLHGPGIMQMLDNEDVRKAIQDGAVKRFDKRIDHEIKHILDRETKT